MYDGRMSEAVITPPAQLLLTVEEAAQCLRLSRTTVYTLISSGSLRAVSIGSNRRIAYDDLCAFVERLRQELAA